MLALSKVVIIELRVAWSVPACYVVQRPLQDNDWRYSGTNFWIPLFTYFSVPYIHPSVHLSPSGSMEPICLRWKVGYTPYESPILHRATFKTISHSCSRSQSSWFTWTLKSLWTVGGNRRKPTQNMQNLHAERPRSPRLWDQGPS